MLRQKLEGTMPTTKSDLIDELSERLQLPKGKAELIVNCVFDSMTRALEQDERIEIRGFGSFEVRSYKAYEGRNPRTGETVRVAPKRLPFFKVGKELRERINAGAGGENGGARAEQRGDADAADKQPEPAAAAPAEADTPEPAGSWPGGSWPGGGVTSA